MRNIEITKSEKMLLENEVTLLDEIDNRIKNFDKIARDMRGKNRYVELIKTIPGCGEILSKVIAYEISDINRFKNKKKFEAYSGLVPSEYSSNKIIYRGRVIKQANKYLKWALVEASWVAIRSSIYFKSIYLNIKYRRGANKAIVGVARHMAGIIYEMLKENRAYEERIYRRDKIIAAL